MKSSLKFTLKSFPRQVPGVPLRKVCDEPMKARDLGALQRLCAASRVVSQHPAGTPFSGAVGIVVRGCGPGKTSLKCTGQRAKEAVRWRFGAEIHGFGMILDDFPPKIEIFSSLILVFESV